MGGAGAQSLTTQMHIHKVIIKQQATLEDEQTNMEHIYIYIIKVFDHLREEGVNER